MMNNTTDNNNHNLTSVNAINTGSLNHQPSIAPSNNNVYNSFSGSNNNNNFNASFAATTATLEITMCLI